MNDEQWRRAQVAVIAPSLYGIGAGLWATLGPRWLIDASSAGGQYVEGVVVMVPVVFVALIVRTVVRWVRAGTQ